jgi:hypothetical protein
MPAVVDVQVWHLVAGLLVHFDLQLSQPHDQKLDCITRRSGSGPRYEIHADQLVLEVLHLCFKIHRSTQDTSHSLGVLRQGRSCGITLSSDAPALHHHQRNNPVKRGLVEKPRDWSRPAGSSWRFYYLEDSSVLAMDRMP